MVFLVYGGDRHLECITQSWALARRRLQELAIGDHVIPRLVIRSNAYFRIRKK